MLVPWVLAVTTKGVVPGTKITITMIGVRIIMMVIETKIIRVVAATIKVGIVIPAIKTLGRMILPPGVWLLVSYLAI